MWIFGAYGNSNGNSTELEEIKDNTDDDLGVKKVIFMEKTDGRTDENEPWHKMLKGILINWAQLFKARLR